MNQVLTGLNTEAEAIKSKYDHHDIDEAVDGIVNRAADYASAFNNYAALAEQNADAMDQMNEKARIALAQTIGIYDDQKEQLDSIRKESDTLIAEKLDNLDISNQIYATALESKVQRVSRMGRLDKSILSQWEGTNKKLLKLVNELKARFKNPDNIKLADEVLDTHKVYQSVVRKYIETKEYDDLDS